MSSRQRSLAAGGPERLTRSGRCQSRRRAPPGAGSIASTRGRDLSFRTPIENGCGDLPESAGLGRHDRSLGLDDWRKFCDISRVSVPPIVRWKAHLLDLNDFFYFVQVVDRGGFTAAGRTLRIPKSTLSHRIQQLETNLGVRLLNRTSRRFGITDAGGEFYRHAVLMLREAELAETVIRHRLSEPAGTVRCTAAIATMQFAMRDIVAEFLDRYPKVNVVAHATDQYVDIVGENYDVAIRAHSDPLPNSTLVQRTLTPAPWFLFAGAAYVDANGPLDRPHDLAKHPSLFMMRTGVSPIWRLRRSGRRREEVVVPLTPRLLIEDMLSLKQAP